MALKYESNVNSTYLNQLAQQYGLSSAQTQGLNTAGGSPVALGTSGYSLYRDPTSNQIQLNQTSLVPKTTTPAPAPVAKPATPAPVAATPTTPKQTTPTGPYIPTAPTSSTSPYAGQTPTGSGTTSTTPYQTGGPTVQTQFRDALLQQLNTNPNSVSLSDPDLAPQARAYADAQQRAAERAQQDLAEQGFAAGALGTGAYTSELANVQQQRGEAEGQYNAQLLGNAKTQRQQNLNTALGLASGQISSDEAARQAIQALSVQQGLGQSDINARLQIAKNQTSLGLLQAMLSDRQANNSLGLQGALAAAGLNQNAMLHALGL